MDMAVEEEEGTVTGEVGAMAVTTNEAVDTLMEVIPTTGEPRIRTEKILPPETRLISNILLLATLTKDHLSLGIHSWAKGIGHLCPMPMISSASHISHSTLTTVLLLLTTMAEALLFEEAGITATKLAILTTTEAVMEEINQEGMEGRPVMEGHLQLQMEHIRPEGGMEEGENTEVIPAHAVMGTL